MWVARGAAPVFRKLQGRKRRRLVAVVGHATSISGGEFINVVSGPPMNHLIRSSADFALRDYWTLKSRLSRRLRWLVTDVQNHRRHNAAG
jgi:hypothetical protein